MRLLKGLLLGVLFLATGCISKFDGEWLEEGVMNPQSGWELSSTGERRMALQFFAPSTVRTGLYVNRTAIVDAGSVHEDQYWLVDWNRAAQFGGMTAKVEGDKLIAFVVGGPEHHFTRVKDRSIFPPFLRLPPLAKLEGVPAQGDVGVGRVKFASVDRGR